MELPLFNLFNIFIVAPLFIYVAYNIFFQIPFHTFSITIMIVFMVYLIILHTFRLVLGLETIRKNGTFKKEAGVFIFCIACLIIGFNTYFIYQYYHRKSALNVL